MQKTKGRPSFQHSSPVKKGLGPLCVLLLAAWAISALSQTVPEPSIHWVRELKNPTRDVVLYGENLWTGPEKVAQRSTLTLGGEAVPVWMLHGANDQDANRALPYLQIFPMPAKIPAGRYEVTWTRNDGKTLPIVVALAAQEPTGPIKTIFEDVAISEPIIVARGQTRDLEGRRILAAPGFPIDKALVVLMSGARLTNGRLLITRDAPANRGITFESPSLGCRVDGIEITNDKPDGIGIQLRAAERCEIRSVKIVAPRALDANAADELRRNSFIDVECTSPRGNKDGQVGRAIGGFEHLAMWCSWERIDRGPTMSSQGSPLDRMCFFECQQHDTGVTEGASEGTLAETKKVFVTSGQIINRQVSIRTTEAARPPGFRAGYFVATMDDAPRWARVERVQEFVTPDARGFILSLDRDLTRAEQIGKEVPLCVGNGVAESAFLRCSFEEGKSGIWFWGLSLNNRVIGCDFRDLDFGIGILDRRRGTGDTAFTIGMRTMHNTTRRVDRLLRALP
jgi:hypothetical protein